MVNIVYKKGTKVMGWRNTGFTACDLYFDRPFCGEVIFYNSYDNLYEIQAEDRSFPIRVDENSVTLFVQEIYDKAIKLHNESMEHHKSYIKCKLDMKKLLSPVEGEF